MCNIYKKTGFQWKYSIIRYYKIHDICIEEVNVLFLLNISLISKKHQDGDQDVK
jgi:hypothetical protein